MQQLMNYFVRQQSSTLSSLYEGGGNQSWAQSLSRYHRPLVKVTQGICFEFLSMIATLYLQLVCHMAFVFSISEQSLS